MSNRNKKNKKSKKQPYRNALLKLKRERVVLDKLFKENQLLNASALYTEKEAQTLLRSAEEDKEQVNEIRQVALDELQKANQYHPYLASELNIRNVELNYALTYRIGAPKVHWDDSKNQGLVKLTCYDQTTGKYETAAYGFSERFTYEYEEYAYNMIDDMGKRISEELIRLTMATLRNDR